jgi:pimeloyl-ACP methyl ester carboxylesterase
MKASLQNHKGEKIEHRLHPGERVDALLILGHGVTGNMDRPLLVALAEGLSSRGWPCMRISFSGNGNSGGSFEEATISKEVEDLGAVLDAVPVGIRVAYAGHSMGGAVGVIRAAADPRIRVLVSLAGMTHTAEFCDREFGEVQAGEGCMWDEPGCPLSREYVEDMHAIRDTLASAGNVRQPWLLIHGTDDDVVPIRDSHDAHEAAASDVKQFIPVAGAGHSFDEKSYPAILDAMDAWLGEHLG